MKLVTWNINGIRATKKPLKDILDSLQADVVCLQETKVTRDQLESEVALVDGYNSYFSFSQNKAGYSGVATYCKNAFAPVRAQAGLTDAFEAEADQGKIGCYGKQSSVLAPERLEEIDSEGRAVLTQHAIREPSDGNRYLLTIINVYCPRSDPDRPERKAFKLDFYKALEERAGALVEDNNFVVVLGDFNVSHRRIDHCDPNDPIVFYDSPARQWMDGFLYDRGDYTLLRKEIDGAGPASQVDGLFVDLFRYFHPKKQDMFTCWCTSSRARQTNYGTRIDYVCVDKHLAPKALECELMTDFDGSDHCPVAATLDCDVTAAKVLPPLCTQHVTEFGGKQRKLSAYFLNATARDSQIDVSGGVKRFQFVYDRPVKKQKSAKPTSQTTLRHFVKTANKTDAGKEGVAQANRPKNIPLPANANKPSKKKASSEVSNFWKNVLKGPDPPPLCSGHKEPCVMRTVKKTGPNLGKKFYCCARPEGLRSNPQANCQHFQWKK